MPFLFVASIHTMMYTAVYKYVSITDPFGSGNRHLAFFSSSLGVRTMIIATWSWAALAGLLTISPLTEVTYKAMTSQCGPAYPNSGPQYFHFSFFVVTCYIVPLVIVAVCYARLFRAIRNYGSRMRRTTTEPPAFVYAQQRRVTGTLLLVVTMFVFSWTSWAIYAFCTIFIKNINPYANPIVSILLSAADNR
jgi:7 transmembrane receptor (rhodopsin family)